MTQDSLKAELHRLAGEVRRTLLHRWECMDAACLPASEALAERLFGQGYKPVIVKGTFAIDRPNPEFYDDWDPEDFESEEAMEEAKYHPLHFWVEVGGLIVDITADQFQIEVDERIPEIVIGTYDELGRYRKTSVEEWPLRTEAERS